MGASSAKPIEATGVRAPEGKMQNIPLLCVEAICRFTPTSKLVRLYSTDVPLPGANWNVGLEAELKKRRPFSLSQALSRKGSRARADALFDSSGAKVAAVKHPEAFQFSPLCELVQSLAVPVHEIPASWKANARLCFAARQPLLPHLQNIGKLTLIGVFEEPYLAKINGKVLPIPVLKKTLPLLESFAVEQWHGKGPTLDVILIEMLPEMSVLKHLDIYVDTFARLVRATVAGSKDSEGIRRVLAGLSSAQLRYTFYGDSATKALRVLSFLSGCCTQLTHLSMMVDGQLKPYLVALRAIVSLNTLGLQIADVNMTGMSFGEDEVVRSVLDLRLVYNQYNQSFASEKVAIASLFPNVKTAALYFFELAATLLEKQVWPKLEKLTCFRVDNPNGVFSIARVLSWKNLPPVVDLSPIIADDLASDYDSLTQIYQAMQSGPVKSLRLRGPVHRDALPYLRARLDLFGEKGKVTAWRDRDVGDQTSIFRVAPVSEYTDVRIVGTKENGGDFAIRVVHQLAKKKKGIFD